MRVKRIGSTTAGLSLIGVGVVMIIAIFTRQQTFLLEALRFWPVILIMLGLEILLATYIKTGTERKYDIVSIILMLLCVLLAFGCEAARLAIEFYLR